MNKWDISTPTFDSDQINEKLKVAPWEGHRWFAYDYINFIEPNTIVELGTHYGCSFFSFCQAVKDFNLNTNLIAIDTWSGDEQAGYYDEEVYRTVKSTVSAYFSHLNIDLKRMTFDNALSEVNEGTADLIHIDGLHTYEAVKHDFETWLPKLSKDGVIFFHDVFSPLEYGSNVFWSEIKQRYSYLEFKHSWGLGILFPKGDKVYNLLLDQNIEDKINLYTYKALYSFEQIKTNDLSFMVEERDKIINDNTRMIAERDEAIRSNGIMISERDKTIRSNEIMISERDKIIEKNESMIYERDVALGATEKLVKERDQLIRNMEKMIEERDQLCNQYQNEIQNLRANIVDLHKRLELLETKVNYYESKKIIFNFRNKAD